MVKIPTYDSRLTPTPTFTRPQQVRGISENVEQLANFANKVADEQAQIKAYEKGFKQQQENTANNFVAENVDAYSITGNAYTKGARAAFVSNFKTEAENELNQYALDNQYEPEKYKKNFENYKTKSLQSVPQILLPEVTDYLDSLGGRLYRSVQSNKVAFDRKDQLVSISNRFEKLLPELSNAIKTEGYDTNTAINIYGELFTNVKSLEEAKFDPVTTNNLKIQLQDEIIQSALIKKFNEAEDKKQFITDVQKGNVSELLTDIAETYDIEGFQFKKQLTTVESNKLSSSLNTLLSYEITNTKIERQSYNKKFDNWYSVSLQGLDAGTAPDLNEAKNLFFSEEKLDEYKDKIEIVNAIAPDVNKSRFGTLAESQNLLKESQSQQSILLSQPAGDTRNKDLQIVEQKVKALAQHVQFKQEAINNGDPFKLLSLQGINYSFDNEEEIAKTHELVKTHVGVSADRLNIMPKANLETFKEEFLSASSQQQAMAVVGKHKAQFGKYINQFLRDVEFEDGSRVVFDFVETQPSNAGVIWQSIKNLKQNKSALENSRDSFKDDEKAFKDKFVENFGSAFKGNEEVFNQIYAGATAYYYKTLATVGDNDKAIQNTIKLFSNEGGVYQYVDINNQSVFVPPTVDAKQLKINAEDMLANPHKYNITSSNTFTLQDIVENKDEYTVVVEGGSAKLIQNSNILFAAEIFQKLPSGSKSYLYSDVLVSTDDGIDTETSMLDFDETWSYDKNKNFNKKLFSSIPKTKNIQTRSTSDVGVETFAEKTVDTNVNEKVTALKEYVYKELADKDGMSYVDVFSADLAITTRDQQNLNAISYVIKDGGMEDWILRYLGNFDYLGKLNDEGVRQQVLKTWEDKTKRIRTTRNVESVLMSPLQSLTDIVRDIAIVNPLEDNVGVLTP